MLGWTRIGAWLGIGAMTGAAGLGVHRMAGPDGLVGRRVRLVRLMRELQLFQAARRGLTSAELAEKMGISQRQAQRDIAVLETEEGVPFVKDGRRYHHILDPERGEPAAGCRSVTIVTEKATLADALSTGVFVLGPTSGMALIERLPDVEGVIVSARNEILISSGLKQRLILLAPPTDAP